MKLFLAIVVAVVLVLHQDVWFWTGRSLLFGFLPVALAWHAAYCLLAAATMALLVRFAWPAGLEDGPERPKT